MRKNPLVVLAALAAALILLSGLACQQAEEATPTEVVDTTPAVTTAKAELVALGESGVTGSVTFTEVEGGVQVEAHVNGLTPGQHGFVIHQWGDCTAADGSAAGDHLNPEEVDHGDPAGEMAHAGDLGNLEAGEDGHAHFDRVSPRVNLKSGDASIQGRAVMVYADPDDLTTQPDGAAGAPVACGVINLE
jgi:Cu-Zn family superoxide dismutase